MINLTQHAITVRGPNGDVTFPPSGIVARVVTSETVVGICHLTGVAIVTRITGEVTGLPLDGSPCLVSGMVLSAVPGMVGVFAPDSGYTAIRENGQVVAVTRLVSA